MMTTLTLPLQVTTPTQARDLVHAIDAGATSLTVDFSRCPDVPMNVLIAMVDEGIFQRRFERMIATGTSQDVATRLSSVAKALRLTDRVVIA